MIELAEEQPRSVTPTVGGETVELSQESDVTIVVSSNKKDSGQRRLVKFRLQQRALTTNSEYFSASIRFNSTNGYEEIQLKDDDIGAMYVWFLYMQVAKEKEDGLAEDGEGENQAKRRRLDSRQDRAVEEKLLQHDVVKDTDVDRIWHIINAADKYLLDASILRGFFDLWYKKNVHVGFLEEDLARQVALPCYMFDHAEGFSEVTKWLAYNHIGHITEKRPEGFKWSYVRLAPPDFVGPMNHARGSLRTTIHRGIWEEIESLLRRGHYACECGEWASTAGHYFAALVATDAYTLEKMFPKASVIEILNRLKFFKMRHQGSCHICSVDWAEEVALARSKTLRNFDGLCIDCMDRSRPKRENSDVDYWRQSESIDGRWDVNCRIRHDEPTWYISWCGRAEHRQKLIERHKEEKRSVGSAVYRAL